MALLGGLLFIIVLLGIMWIWGELDDWYALSGYSHYTVNSSQQRFMPEPYGCNDTSVPGRNHSGCTGTWYYWKLPPPDATAGTRALVWLCYSLHQIFIWGLIYRAQLIVEYDRGKDGKKYSTNLRWFNWSMLLVNALFHILHLVQTHWTYDATAQDVSISSSQASVIMMICFIILIEYKERGIMFMWPNPTSEGKLANVLRLHPGPINLVRKYHGIAFAWASIYTFWYHPMENTWGHTLGFFHTAIVLLQGSLAFTEVHLNRYWRLLNECWVLIHATVIAVQTGNPAIKSRSDLWPIFTFGFGFVFAFTQVFSFPIWKKLPSWTRIIPPVLYLAIVCALCGTIVAPTTPGGSGFSRMYVMVFIPAEEYLQVLLSWLTLYVFIWIESKAKSPAIPKETSVGFQAETDKDTEVSRRPSPTKQALYLCSVVVLYAVLILLSYLYKQAHFGINMTAIMVVFVLLFSLFVCITIIMFKQLLGPQKPLIRPCSSKVHNSEEVPETSQTTGF